MLRRDLFSLCAFVPLLRGGKPKGAGRSKGTLRRLVVGILLAGAILVAVEPDRIHSGPVYTTLTEFPVVRVLVTVPPDAKLATVPPTSFSLKVDGGQVTRGTQVQFLSDTGLGMAAVVLLDVSGSMAGGPLNAVRAGLVKFTSEATLADKVAICTVADETRWDANWNDTDDQRKAALVALKPRGKLTRLYDGLLEVMAKYPEAPMARRLVIISDGHDEGSQHTIDEVLATAAQQHVVIDSVGLTQSDARFLKVLARLSEATGGVYRPAPSLTALELLVGGGIKRYRTIPVVTFKPEGLVPDGKSHNFLVTWNGAGPALESAVDSTLPEDDPKPSEPPPPPPPTKVEPEPVTAKESVPDTPVGSPQRMAKQWLYVGAGAAAALALGMIAFFLLRTRKSTRPGSQLPSQPPPFAFPDPPVAFAPAVAVPMVPFNPPTASKGSVFMALPPDPAGPPTAEPQLLRLATRFPAPTSQRPAAWLVCIEGAMTGKSVPVDETEFWLGASANNRVILSDDPTVSGNHACIVFENGGLGLFDHRSTNGVFVNDQRLAADGYPLAAGDRIRIGRSIFIVRPHDPS